MLPEVGLLLVSSKTREINFGATRRPYGKGVPTYWFQGHENLQNTYIIGHSLHYTIGKLRTVTERACQRGEGKEGGSALTEEGAEFGGRKMSTMVLLRLVPAEGNMPRTVAAFLHQGLVELPARPRMNGGPAIFAIILEAGDISTEKRSELPSAAGPLTLITQLVVQDIWLNFHPFIYLSMLQLDKAGTDSSYVTLLVREGNSPSSFRVLQLGVSVNPSIADTSVQPIHYHGQLHSSQGSRHTTNKYSFPGVKRLGTIHHKVTVTEVPWPNLHGLVFDGGAGHTQVEFAIFLDTGIDQSLD